MPWKIIASAFGWKAADDEDENLLVVWHPKLSRHYSGADAWRRAVLLSIRSPSAHPLLRREGRP
ncbi:MAG: hypothetical protein B7Y01_05510 [Xanthobacter sp. 17-67-6]|jgi:hypothetical protein|nr:MAG: hypothetical protein B7Z15_14520 [Rhizobiales bacterium 32-66-8]OYY76586.1 MAG: hypothetical protein B7Y61_18335 [Rhizobiales bacterium 35-66-30]OYZ85836.1 MAG: hypothetical protein B7Y01_05510 [Xanthobacter sp. 17-67-6]